MKKLMIIIILILLATLANAKTERVTLEKYESYTLNGKNITILNINDKDDKITICVNNVKNIVSDDKIVNGARINLKSVSNESVDLQIEVILEGQCIDECSNSLCLECINNLECNDNNENTIDLCINNKCIFKRFITEETKEQVIEEETQREISAVFKREETENNNSLLLSILVIIIIISIIVIMKTRK